MKKYRIRVYVPTEEIGLIVNDAIEAEAFTITNSYDGMNGIITIYDGFCSGDVLKVIIS